MRASSTTVSRNTWWAQALHNRLIAMVFAMIVVVPLVAVPANLALRGVVTFIHEAFAVLLATTLLWNGQLDLRREKVLAFARTGPNVPVVLLMGWTVALCFNSPLKVYGIQGVLQLAAGVLLYFIVGYQFRQSKHLSMLVDVLLFLAVAVSVTTAMQYMVTPESRGKALFGNQQLLGSLLMILLPIVASFAIADKSPNRRIVAQVTTVLTLGSLMLAQTRSAWLGAALGLTVIALFAIQSGVAKQKAQKKSGRSFANHKHKLVMPVVMAVIALVAVVTMVSQNSTIAARGATLSNISIDKSFQDRLAVWRGATEMIKEHPYFGVGPGTYSVLQYAYTGQGQPITRNSGIVSLASQAHNFYLQTAAELGLPGLAMMVIILIVFMVTAAARVPKMDEGIRRTLLIASMGSVAAFAVDAMSSPSWQFGQVSMFLWLIMGIGISCLRPRAKHGEEK